MHIMEHFCKNSGAVAVLKSVGSLDENFVRDKRRTGARSYVKSNPITFYIKFCDVVGWLFGYLNSIMDNW